MSIAKFMAYESFSVILKVPTDLLHPPAPSTLQHPLLCCPPPVSTAQDQPLDPGPQNHLRTSHWTRGRRTS